MTEDLQLVQLRLSNLLNKEGSLTILRLIHHRSQIVQLASRMTLNLLSNPQILVFTSSKRAYQNLLPAVKAQRMKIETFLQSLEVALKFLELQRKAKDVKIGETKICLKINKLELMKLKSKERS